MKIIITPKAFLQLKYYTDLNDNEISGIGKSKITPKKDIIISEVAIFKQNCSSGSTLLDSQSLAKFFIELSKKGGKSKDWNIWWHSHADMNVFWSTTDEETIKSHVGLQSYIISLVTNKDGEFKGRVDIFPKDTSPFNKPIYCSIDIDVELQYSPIFLKERNKLTKIIEQANKKIEELDELENENPQLKEQCQKDINKNVTQQHFQSNYTTRTINYKPKNKKWQWWENYGTSTPHVHQVSKKKVKLLQSPKNYHSKGKNNFNNSIQDPFYYNDNPTLDDLPPYLQ